MKPVRVKEGDWFLVPLRDAGFALGVVARRGTRGVLLGYFFGPRRKGAPEAGTIASLRSGDAVLVRRFGDLGLREGAWELLGPAPSWRREEWPLPEFGRIDSSRGVAWRARYGDDLAHMEDLRCEADEARRLPRDVMAGYGAIEIVLTRIINGTGEADP